MRNLLALIVVCVIVFAIGCTPDASGAWRQAVVGSWILDQNVMGEHTQELLAIRADGSFESKVLFRNAAGMTFQSNEQGEWRIEGNEIELSTKKKNGEVPNAVQVSRDRRVIKKINSEIFVTADKKFDIELLRKRAPAGFDLPAQDASSWKSPAK